MEITQETIRNIVREEVNNIQVKKDWLTKKEVMEEFGISTTVLWRLCNDPENPLPYSSMGSKKHLYNRADINAHLERNKRNANF